jgi:hypothetical protein
MRRTPAGPTAVVPWIRQFSASGLEDDEPLGARQSPRLCRLERGYPVSADYHIEIQVVRTAMGTGAADPPNHHFFVPGPADVIAAPAKLIADSIGVLPSIRVLELDLKLCDSTAVWAHRMSYDHIERAHQSFSATPGTFFRMSL